MGGLGAKLGKDPWGLVRRACYKLFIAPFKYRVGRQDYDASRYWRDRLSRHGQALTGVGDEGLSEDDNAAMYRQAGQLLLAHCRKEGIDLASARVLEIGCGNGFYAQLLADHGVRHYRGVDITDVLFPALRKRFPDFEFVKGDVTANDLQGEFDLVLMIDVIEHIVRPEKLSVAFDNVKRCMAGGGVLMLAPIVEKSRRSLFYVRFWSEEDVRPCFPGFQWGNLIPFRYSRLVSIRKP